LNVIFKVIRRTLPRVAFYFASFYPIKEPNKENFARRYVIMSTSICVVDARETGLFFAV